MALWGDTATGALYDLVGQHLGYSDPDTALRQCRRWARGETDPPWLVLWMLIRSREGYRVLRYINKQGAPPTYWTVIGEWQQKAALVDRLCKCVSELN
ncbi:MAG: hypothetical protein GEU95_01085 [Rhizobiales bacterium]|nr:hypothetical protein [Hyphomicrobiales bacterium]